MLERNLVKHHVLTALRTTPVDWFFCITSNNLLCYCDTVGLLTDRTGNTPWVKTKIVDSLYLEICQNVVKQNGIKTMVALSVKEGALYMNQESENVRPNELI